MKTFIVTTIALFAGIAQSIPEGVSLVPKYDEKLPDMVFKGPAFVGGPNITLSGTSKSVYEQLLKINPKYDPWAFPDYQKKMGAMGFAKGMDFPETANSKLIKRGWTNCNVDGKRVGNVVTQCTEGYLYLKNLNGWCGAPAGWGGCSRVSCSTNCGISLCNDNPYPIDVWCGNIAGDYLDITNECAIVLGGQIATCKGQIFRDGPPAWNTILKAHSC